MQFFYVWYAAAEMTIKRIKRVFVNLSGGISTMSPSVATNIYNNKLWSNLASAYRANSKWTRESVVWEICVEFTFFSFCTFFFFCRKLDFDWPIFGCRLQTSYGRRSDNNAARSGIFAKFWLRFSVWAVRICDAEHAFRFCHLLQFSFIFCVCVYCFNRHPPTQHQTRTGAISNEHWQMRFFSVGV